MSLMSPIEVDFFHQQEMGQTSQTICLWDFTEFTNKWGDLNMELNQPTGGGRFPSGISGQRIVSSA